MPEDKSFISESVSDPVQSSDGVPSDAAPNDNKEAQPPADQPRKQPASEPSDPASEANATNDSVDARTLANRENAKKSTGPTSSAGKAVSSANAFTHGLFAQDLAKYLEGDELARYERWVNGIVNDLYPVGDLELVLARRAADIQFRLERLRTTEFHNTSSYCVLKNSLAGRLENHRDPLGLISLYDSRFTRSFKSTMDELRRLQQARKDHEREAFAELKTIAAAHLQQNATFDPSKFGFVISAGLVMAKAHLKKVQDIASASRGEGSIEKRVVDYTGKVPKNFA